MGKATPMFRCLDESHIALVLMKVHKRVYGSHIGEKALTHKLLRASY